MEMKKQKNRWIMLFCICCNTFCFGGVYAWSAFSGELANYMGWDYSKVTVAYSIMLMCVALMGLVGGMLLQRFGARKLMIAPVLGGDLAGLQQEWQEVLLCCMQASVSLQAVPPDLAIIQVS